MQWWHLTKTKCDVGMLERLGENTKACIGVYSTRPCVTDHAYSDFCVWQIIVWGQILFNKYLLNKGLLYLLFRHK
jgi:hypothetical protein